MRYALKVMAFSAQKSHFDYLYYFHEDRYSIKLSDAATWENVDLIKNLIKDKHLRDYRIVHVSEKELFEARLKG